MSHGEDGDACERRFFITTVFCLYQCHATGRESSHHNQKSWLLLLCVVPFIPLVSRRVVEFCSCEVCLLCVICDGTTYKASYCETGVRAVCFCRFKEQNNTTKPLLTGKSTAPCTGKNISLCTAFTGFDLFGVHCIFRYQTNRCLGKLGDISNWCRWV